VRYLTMRPGQKIDFDVIVVGSGIAGLYAALKAAAFARVCLVSKGRLQETNTWLAQGGIAAAMGEEDSPQDHLRDTVAAGAGACNPEAVNVMVQEGPSAVRDLLLLGTPFDCHGDRLALTREGAHHKNRILHCGGDATGRLIQQTLQERLHGLTSVTVLENTFVTDLLTRDGRVCGVRTLQGDMLTGAAVILATGGLGQVYSRTSNPAVATGDGVAMAYRAGAVMADLEFVQFHPTVFQGSSETETFLLSEALRGEGGVLRNNRGQAFMADYHAMADLGPRDVVARAILDQMKQQGGLPVWLDMTHKSRDYLKQRFPTIYRLARERGLDMATEWLPVSPAAHYAMGGILTGLSGETSLPGLYACGEAACSGVHGANRLASNSLLEGLVFAARAVNALSSAALPAPAFVPRPVIAECAGEETEGNDIREVLRRRMFGEAGVLRNGPGLALLQEELSGWAADLPPYPVTRAMWETKNLLTVAQLIVAGALQRRESRGGHFRSDFPGTNSRFIRFEQKEGKRRASIAV
jgi:L-aspartate oxidase